MSVSRIHKLREADPNLSVATEKSLQLDWLKGRLLESTVIVAVAAATFALPGTAQAQVYTWGGTGRTTLFTDYNLGSDWSNPPAGAPPVTAGTAAVFDSTGNTSVDVTAGPITPDYWQFTTNSQFYAVSGQNVNFNGLGLGGFNLINDGGASSISNNMTGGGGVSVTGGTLTVSGFNSFNGGASVTGGTFINNGTFATSVVVGAAGNFNNNGTVNGGLTNSGTTNAQGTINDGITNQGTGIFTVKGALTTNSTFTNKGTARLAVFLGDFTGITTFTNNSTSASAVTVSSGVSLSATTIANNAGTFTNGGTVTTTGGTTNAAGATFTQAIGTLNGGFTNNGTANNFGGIVNGGLTNSGTYSQTNGSTNGGTTNAGTINANSGAFNGGIANNAGGTFNIGGTVTSDSTFDNAAATSQLLVNGGTYTVTGSLTNSGTNAGGGILISSGATLNANGGITNNVGATIVNSGTVSGTTTNNGGTVNNNASMAGVINLSGTFDNNNGGSITTLNVSGGTFANANGATVSGAATISAGTVTNAGAFSSTLGLTGGTFTNNAGGQVQGTTTNNGGTVTNSGGTFAAVTNTTGTFNNNSGSVTGVLTNSGTGSNGGTIASLSNTAGTFTNNGTISGPATISGGTLSGIGTIGNLTVNGGTFAPGNGTPGASMTVSGSLAFTSAATYLVQVNPSTSSFTTVSGTATLGGAIVSANFAAGTYVAKQYTIVTAGGISGTFNPTVAKSGLPSGFNTALSYDATHAYLNLALSFAPPSGSLNGNQQNVGNAIINFFSSNGSIASVFGGLTPAGLTQLSGEIGSAPQQTTFQAMTQFMGLMTDPLVAGRGDGISSSGAPNAYAEESLAYAGRANGRSKSGRDAYAAMSSKAPVAPAFEQGWSVWAAGFGGSQATDGNATVGSNSTTSNLYGTAVGADYRISRDTLVGFALAGGGTNFTVANAVGGGRSDLFQAGAFFRHNVGPAYITGALAYGWQDITTDRTVTVAGIDRLRAEFNANAYSGRLEGGYRFASQGFGWTPYAAAQATTFDLPDYAEQAIVGSNQFALAYNAESVTDPRTELGVRTDKSIAMDDGILTLRGRLAWARDYSANRSIGATFQTLPGASFVVNGAAMAADWALVTAAVERRWLNGWSAATTFEGEFSNVTRSYAAKGLARYEW